MMDSITDESSPHLHSNLTLLIVINIISVSSLSYRSEPVSCPQSAGPTGASPSPGQSVAVLGTGILPPVHREQAMEMEPGSGLWALEGGPRLADA